MKKDSFYILMKTPNKTFYVKKVEGKILNNNLIYFVSGNNPNNKQYTIGDKLTGVKIMACSRKRQLFSQMNDINNIINEIRKLSQYNNVVNQFNNLIKDQNNGNI